MTMQAHPEQRQQRILEYLQQQAPMSIQALVERLGVSTMTVHRDLNKLVEAGKVKKIHGGVTLAATTTPLEMSTEGCAMCGKHVQPRTAFVIQCQDGSQRQACCPHCGLMLLHQQKQAVSALATGFLYGHRVNVRQAAYLVESEVPQCCLPSVICFATAQDAGRFSQGFGGRILDFSQILEFLHQHMHIPFKKSGES